MIIIFLALFCAANRGFELLKEGQSIGKLPYRCVCKSARKKEISGAKGVAEVKYVIVLFRFATT